MKKEIFKQIPNYEGYYEVSNIGNVKSLKKVKINNKYEIKEKMMSLIKRGNYLEVCLHKEGKRKLYRVHQLVAMAFLGHIPNRYEKIIDHVDNNPLNNSVENLQIVDCRTNLTKDKKNKSSKYTGVSWCKKVNKWKSTISIKNKTVNLKYHDTEYDAHLCYEQALKMLKNNDFSFIKEKKVPKSAYQSKVSNKWVALLRYKNIRKNIGTFLTEYEANEAVKNAEKMIKNGDLSILYKRPIHYMSKKVIDNNTKNIYNSARECYEANKNIIKYKYHTFCGMLNGGKKNKTNFEYCLKK